MKYISLFAGIGGFDLALNRLGHECVWANEWDKYAAQIYNKNFLKQDEGARSNIREYQSDSNARSGWRKTNSVDTRDIRTVPTSEIPDHDLLVGGFPCQAFSIAGKRRGFDDTRGTLFFEIARILKDKNPKYFILENVKGLLSHDNGFTFKTIISTLNELGYDLEWQVLNSKNFGVPQNRERVFIVGHLRGQPRPEVFPITENNSEDIVLPTVTTRVTADSNVTYVRKRQTQETKSSGQVNKQKGIKPDTSDIVGREAHTAVIRRLTPTECERLQGFPDGWTEGISDTQRYKCLGNAVTVNVVYEVAKRLGL
jgi:DNA (cytosine-5)-methyltransferase 1